jgi:hypothetical protein
MYAKINPIVLHLEEEWVKAVYVDKIRSDQSLKNNLKCPYGTITDNIWHINAPFLNSSRDFYQYFGGKRKVQKSILLAMLKHKI